MLLADDRHHLGARAVHGVGLDDVVALLDLPLSATRDDTSRAAAALRTAAVGAVVVLGGDGTCRDIATGWPDAPLVAISTGTNNVYPQPLDGTAAGCTAGFVASGARPVRRRRPAHQAARRHRRRVHRGRAGRRRPDRHRVHRGAGGDRPGDGARRRGLRGPAVEHRALGDRRAGEPGRSVGAGRRGGAARPGGAPAGARADRAGCVRHDRCRRSTRLDAGQAVTLHGPGVLAYDGERHRRLAAGETVRVTVDGAGPWLLDVDATLAAAADRRCFDACPTTTSKERSDGD